MRRSLLAAVIVALAVATAGAQSPDWAVETVAFQSRGCHLAFMPNGTPAMAYTYLGDPSGKSYVCLTQKIGASWTGPEIVSEGIAGGLAVNPDTGEAIVAYSFNGLKLARRNPTGNWTSQAVSSDTPYLFAYEGISLALHPLTRNPAIAYSVYSSRKYQLKLAEYDGSRWTSKVITSGSSVAYPSLAYDADPISPSPAVAYEDSSATPRKVMFAHWNRQAALWETEVVDSSGVMSPRKSLAYDPVSGIPAIAYLVGGGARFARRTSPIAPYWVREGYFGALASGWQPSLVYDPAGVPFIGHSSSMTDAQGLWMSRILNGSWLNEYVEPEEFEDDYYEETSIALSPTTNLPAIAYVIERPDGSYDLKFAQRISSVYSFLPEVTIASPPDKSTYASGAPILFSGTATDPEDGDLSNAIVWTSNLDGQIGIGQSVTAVLSNGLHTVRASATDSAGKTGSASVKLRVGVAPTAGVVRINYLGSKSDILIGLTVENDFGDPVSGALVYFTVYLNGKLYARMDQPSPTASDGYVHYRLKKASGTFTTVVTNIAAQGYVWDGLTPPNSFTY
jgi:hypothetical protein